MKMSHRLRRGLVIPSEAEGPAVIPHLGVTRQALIIKADAVPKAHWDDIFSVTMIRSKVFLISTGACQ
jgi:hypothetical protein